MALTSRVGRGKGEEREEGRREGTLIACLEIQNWCRRTRGIVLEELKDNTFD